MEPRANSLRTSHELLRANCSSTQCADFCSSSSRSSSLARKQEACRQSCSDCATRFVSINHTTLVYDHTFCLRAGRTCSHNTSNTDLARILVIATCFERDPPIDAGPVVMAAHRAVTKRRRLNFAYILIVCATLNLPNFGFGGLCYGSVKHRFGSVWE